MIFESLNLENYEFVELNALKSIPEDKGDLAFATRMYLIEGGKL